MTNSTNTKQSTKPTYIAFQVTEREGQPGIFNRVGAAWPHKDEKGLTIQLEAIPVDGRIVLRVPSEKPE